MTNQIIFFIFLLVLAVVAVLFTYLLFMAALSKIEVLCWNQMKYCWVFPPNYILIYRGYPAMGLNVLVLIQVVSAKNFG